MKKNWRFSIKYKLLSFLILFPTVMLSLFLWVIEDTIKKDKMAYILDSSLMVSRSSAAHTRAEISALLNIFKPIIYEFSYKKKLRENTDAIFINDPYFSVISIYKIQGDSLFLVDSREKEKGMLNAKVTSKSWWPQMREAIKKNGQGFRIEQEDGTAIIGQRFGAPESPSGVFMIVSVYKMNDLFSRFQGQGDASLYLVKDSGEVLLGPKATKDSPSLFDSLNQTDLLSVLKKTTMNETSQFLDSKSESKNKILISAVNVGFTDLAVLSLVDESVAISAIKSLWNRVTLFFVIMISATVLLSLAASKRLLKSILLVHNATSKIADGVFDVDIKVDSSDEVGELAEAFNTMAKEIDRLFQQMIQKTRMEIELKTAKTVQETFFPTPYITGEMWQLAGHFEPATECGGDWWFHYKKNDKLYIIVADATGHGVPAALITCVARTVFSIAEVNNIEIVDIMRLLNEIIFRIFNGEMLMTGFMLSLDTQNGQIQYCNASHEPPFILKKNNSTKDGLSPLNLNDGPRLGESLEFNYTQDELTLEKDDLLILFTDGVYSLKNKNYKNFRERDLVKCMLARRSEAKNAKDFVHLMVEDFRSFQGAKSLEDDLTFIALEWSGPT